MQYAAIKTLLQEFKPQRGSNNFGRNPSTNHTLDGDDMCKLEKRNVRLQHSIVKVWAKVGFFSSHGHGIPAGHDSRNCPGRKSGHVETSTR